MERLYAAYGDSIEHVIVYIREAHPEMLKDGGKTGVVGRPKDIGERTILATECLMKYKLTMPTVIDGMDGKVGSDYAAAPVRVCIVDKDGKAVYYGDRGPSGFKIPEIERALKKIVGNGGYMPAPPEPAWGKAADGLRLGVSVDPAAAMVGDGVAVIVKFENVSDEAISLKYKQDEAVGGLSISNGDGVELSLTPTKSRRRRGGGAGEPSVEVGKIFESKLEGTIVAAGESAAVGGEYSVVYTYEDEVGKVASGEFKLELVTAKKEGCVDCHGVADYHHAETRTCDMCHVGEVGEDDFDTKKDVCGSCHPREGKQGRPLIVGEEGQFSLSSTHRKGALTNEDCLMCHPTDKHADGVVDFAVPGSGGTKVWDGSRTEFCLACHGGEAVDGVSFPEDSKGSGYDKSGFVGTAHAEKLKGQGCGHCHEGHGSEHPSLLKGAYMTEKRAGKRFTAADAELCWTCHDQDKVLKGENAFAKRHGKHMKENSACVFCHNVHGGTDEGEAGMIDFGLGMDAGSGAKFIKRYDGVTSFVARGSRGTCYIDCHEKHDPETYSRDKKLETSMCEQCHGE